MGVTGLGELFSIRYETDFTGLKRRKIALDAFNTIYQFLSTIRQPDGTPLTDSKGNPTSHLSGIIYRVTKLLEEQIQVVFVFDGDPPKLKSETIKTRSKIREEAEEKYEEALKEGDLARAFSMAQRTSKITKSIVEESKKLLELLGIPVVQAPQEGEAQAAWLTKQGLVDYCGSQDFDSFLFGSPNLVRNLTVSGKRKLPKKNKYVHVKPEKIFLDENLKNLGITREQLIDIAILMGTDYNPGGIQGFGPKKSLKLIKDHGSLENAIEKGLISPEFPWKEIREIFLNPKIIEIKKLDFRPPKTEEIIKFLCEEKEFAESRVRNALERAYRGWDELHKQASLDDFF